MGSETLLLEHDSIHLCYTMQMKILDFYGSFDNTVIIVLAFMVLMYKVTTFYHHQSATDPALLPCPHKNFSSAS